MGVGNACPEFFTFCKSLYTELVFMLGLSQTHRNMDNTPEGSKSAYREMPQWEPHSERVKWGTGDKGALSSIRVS